MKRDYRLFLKDILAAIDAIEKFTEGMEFNELPEDDKTSSAVIRKLEVIGEAVRNIPEQIQKKYPEIPWKLMAGMRDRLIHGYFGIDYKLVWDTIKSDLPVVKTFLKKVLKDIDFTK